MSEKRGKQPVACVFSSKIVKNSVSLASDERKTGKIVLRGIPKGRNSEKQCFGMPDELFFVKMSRRGAPKLEKSEKYAFGESRSLKISENKLSGSPEARKI